METNMFYDYSKRVLQMAVTAAILKCLKVAIVISVILLSGGGPAKACGVVGCIIANVLSGTT